MLARILLWRLLGLAALLVGAVVLAWLLHGGIGMALRGAADARAYVRARVGSAAYTEWSPRERLVLALAMAALLCAVLLVGVRVEARRRRRYVRLQVEPYRTDRTSVEGVVAMYEALHKRLQRRWWRRLVSGQPSVALEVHHIRGTAEARAGRALLALACPAATEAMAEAALRSAYPNCRLVPFAGGRAEWPIGPLLRLKKHTGFIRRVKQLDRYELEREPPIDRLLTAMGACGEDANVQLALTPTPALFERYAKWRYKRHEDRLSRERRERLFVRDRSLVEEAELRGGLAVQHRPLYFADLRVVAPSKRACEQIASELRAEGAENRLIERGTAVRHGLLKLYRRRVERGEGNPWPGWHKGVLASTELAALWQLPSVDYATVPIARGALPLAPAPPTIMRPTDGKGLLRDAYGPLSIHPQMRCQNTAVPGTVEQGKSSYLVATVAEDLVRERCAVIVLDPKGDAAEAAVSLVSPRRTCTLLDFAHPTCGFNPLAVDAPADTIADYVVGALKGLFTDADIRASSDRYLRNAIIAVLAHDARATLWDAARLLSVGEEGYAYRARVGAHVRTLPEYSEIAQFFTAELAAQLADSRSTTTAKLDAPVNKLARLLNSPSIKRVLLNESLTVDLDRVIAEREVLVVKGALGGMGAGNTAVLMQLLTGMLDAALARQQDKVPAAERVAVALKVDEAPLVVNRNFAETLALKRSAGLETVACWQTDAQWTDRELRAQLDALFAHRVYFATASASDARDAAKLMMAEYSDTVRPGISGLTALGRPDARLHLPKHHAIVSWVTPTGRQAPFVASTIPLRTDPERLALHAAKQTERGGAYLADLAQPHWERSRETLVSGSHPRFGQREKPASTDCDEDAGVDGGVSLGIVRAAEGKGHAGGRGASMPPGRGLRARPDEHATELRSEDSGKAEQRRAPLPERPAESYAELVALDAAHTVRMAKAVASPTPLDPDPLDLEILTLVASMRHVLTSQIHRRFNATRSLTTTQRRLKRLSDAGLVGRFQFHRRDGGGAPMCYVIAPRGVELLQVRSQADASGPGAIASGRRCGDGRLRQARHDVHVAGWGLALERALGVGGLSVRGPEESVLSPPLRATPYGRVAIGPDDLRLPGGRAPHDFLRTDAAGVRVEVERFETVRPDASVEIAGVTMGRAAAREKERQHAAVGADDVCVLIERDDRLADRSPALAAKLERYDHLLTGWSTCVLRFTRRGAPRPLVVFVCRDRRRARECARRADRVLCACRAYAGEHPRDWEYTGRAAILFAAERDVHEGVLLAYGVPPLPPSVRTAAAQGDPRAGESVCEERRLLPALRA
jgi:Replication-relaxation